jgi:chorismate dehydratase
MERARGYIFSMDPLSIGTVPYVNALPLTEGLEDLVREVPSVLARTFRTGRLDAALLPVFEWVRDASRPIIDAGCIASPGPVDSVLLFSRGRPEEARTVLLDESSLTSSALTRILFDRVFNARPEYRLCDPGVDPRSIEEDAMLLIGDPALRAPRDGLVVTDLATAWRKWTGLPFCFAVWLAKDEAAAERVRPVLTAARERGLSARGRLAEENAPVCGLSPEALLTYLTKRITYDFTEPEREAAGVFATLCRDLGLA